MQLSNYLPTELKKYKVHTQTTLFPLEPKDISIALKQKLCPKCNRRLYTDRKGNGRCKSVKCGTFFITKEKLDKYLTIS